MLLLRAGDSIHSSRPTDCRPWPLQLIAGYMTRPYCVRLPSWSRIIGVTFKAAGMAAYSEMPCSLLRNRVLPAAEVMPKSLIAEISSASIQKGGATTTTMSRLGKVLHDARRGCCRRSDSAIREFTEHFRQETDLTVASFCTRFGVSLSTLERWFSRYVGISPTGYLRILRLRKVLGSLAHPGTHRWVELAMRFGFSDQAHLSREFKRIVGVTPRQFSQRCTGNRRGRGHPGGWQRNAVTLIAGASMMPGFSGKAQRVPTAETANEG